jgi:predicted transcriptional regulator
MSTMTVRIPEEKRDMLKIVAGIEKRDIKEILTELVDEYLERHTETLEILSKPGWAKAINTGLKAAEKGDTIIYEESEPGDSYCKAGRKGLRQIRKRHEGTIR